MEVATTNTHHHNHHHHHQQHQHLGHQLHHPAHRLPMAKAQQQQQQQQQQNSLIVSAASDSATRNGNSGGSPRSPFQREVREWQRIDPDTGALLSGRLEADRWINGPLNSYGKISDSQNISQPNGTQHTQRKQLEVLQKRTANGAVQVIRAQTVQTSSSRSWSSSNSNSASTSASASASASPICMQTNVIGGRSILHNHNNSTNNHTNNNNNNSINNSSKHFHSTLQQHLAEANTHWLQLSPPTIAATVDISEVSTDDDLDKAAATIAETQYIVDDGEIDEDAAGDGNGESVCSGGGGVDVDAAPCNYSISRSGSAGSGSGGSKGHALSSSAASSSSTLHSQSSGLLVPDTAPSLKLSNLMKSSSGGSSSSNNSTKLNTHKSAVGKVSLHAIVGGGAGVGDSNSTRVNNDLTESPKSTATTTKSSSEALSGTKTWQPQQQRSNARHLEQATLYGQNSNSSKTRVGVADCDDCYAVVADADESQPRYHQHHLQTQQQQLRRQQQQQSGGLLSETATPTRRRDLESFRLYGDSTAASTLSASATAGAATADNNAKADDLRLSTRQLRRQQQPFGQLSSSALLQRSHSISTDDLSNEWESNEAVAESNEWRRVSKLRRSFQSSSTANNNVNNSKELSTQESTTSSIRRPYDLPASTVSVSRIRAELESGRRLTTAMRNNHVDLAALESILHGPDRTTDASKRNTLLTAESLKEIRGRLKKLSDESLYKDDFIAYQQPPAADEHIEVQQSVRRKLSIPRLRQLTPEESLEISTPTQQPSSAFKVVGATHKPHDNNETLKNLNQKHTSNSLESRQKATRDTSSTEWHSRRKSYGFEKMSPPDSKTMYRMDASTDSGLGRSGELGNWSPTEAAASTAARATVIHFGEPAKTVTSAHYRAGKSPVRRTPDEDLLKRHSIAVDESQYVRDNLRKTSQVHLNGFYEPAEPAAKTTLQLSRFEHNTAESNQGLNAGSTLFQRTQNAQKRVEFCKTEVHFAAESGRVNIVETDGKPPPTNNFRRRRRTTSGPLQTLTKTASTAATTTTAVSTTAAAATTTASNVTHFGDDHQQRHRTIATSVVAYKASLMEPSTVLNDAQAMSAPTSVTVSVQKLCDSQHAEGSRGSYASTTSGVDTTDNENDEIAAIRGILKNKPVKPKPYHLGENIDSADALWGVQLKPVSGGGSSGVGVREKEDSPTAALNKSVAERVRIVEKRHEHNAPNGYSTKINLSLDEPAAARDWPSAGAPKLLTNTDSQPIPNNTNRRPSAQELILQDLREHQRMLDEGLKSTSLIIKTMRSANEFDEAMRRLSIASMESTTMPPIVVPTPMLRSNSYQETVRRFSNTSLESTERELTTQTVVNTSSSATSLAATTISRRLSFESQSAFVTPLSLPPAPLVAPRLKLLGSTEVTVSQQLSQLRRMYDIATQNANDEDTADSADEEVKSYFCPREQTEQSDSGGGTLESSSQEDERAVEYSSGSWSRMKAKRTIWKIEAEERKAVPAVLDKADLPKSNIMSIELHSPQTSLDKRDSFKRNQTPPVAKPRTVSNAVSANEHPQIHVATTVKQTADRFTTAEQQRESLKIVKEARGARKLREHELSYFGVPHVHKHDDNEPKPKLLSNSNSNTMSMSKRSLPSRQRLTVIGNDDTKSLRRHEAHNTDTTTKNTVSETTEAQTKAQTATKWQLLNDKPDLLRHSPIAVEPQLTRRTADVQQRERNSTSVERNKRMSTKELRLEDELNDLDEADNPDEHFYENITNEITPVFKVKSPQPYDRKMDVERDAYILNEMNENADLTMKALSDEAAHKDRRRRRSSLHRRDSKPLETIEEKMHTQTPNDSFIAVKMSRGTLASEAKRHARNDNNTRVRTSSQSSVESCPRARSRSLSSEREYENIRTPKTTRTPSSAATKTQSKITSKQQHRSSSRESQRSARLPYSSGDEVNPREEQRVRMKSKRSSNSTSGTTGRGSSERRSSNSTKKDAEKHGHHSTTTSSRDVEQRRRAASSTTHASQREERGECVPVPPQQRTTSSGRSSSSKRRDEHATSNTAASGGSSGRHTSSRTATEKSRSSANAGVRLLRSLRVGRTTDDAKVSSTEHRASGHRGTSEREREKAHEKEREKESQSKSRGHSTSKTQHHSSSSEHHHRVADTNTHHLAAHSGSMSSKTREHKKSALTAVEKQHERATTPTHSKSSQVINGRHTGQHDGHRKHNDQRRVLHTRPQQNEATSTTTTTHRKRSEHSARERK